MPSYNDYGIVLKSYGFSEADKILNIYTKQNGLVKAICKGTRRLTSRLASRIEQASCCHFQFAKGKNLDLVCECENINNFPLVRSDLKRLGCAILFLEIVNNFAHEKESESEQVYELLYSSLDELQRVGNIELHSIKFISRFLSIHGFKPQFDTCVSCSKEILRSGGQEALGSANSHDLYPYSSALGGLLCKECSKLIDNEPVSPEVLNIIEDVTSNNKAMLETSEPSSEAVRKTLSLLKEHINHRAKGKINSFDLVFSL